MFKKIKSATGPQYPNNLRKRLINVGNGTKNLSRDHRVHALIGRRQTLGGIGFESPILKTETLQLLLKMRMEGDVRLHSNPTYILRIILEIHAGTRTNLQDRTMQAPEELPFSFGENRDLNLQTRGDKIFRKTLRVHNENVFEKSGPWQYPLPHALP